MTRPHRCLWIGLVLLTACGRGGRVSVQPAPQVLLEQARREFRAGDFRKALQSYQRLGFELTPGAPERAEVGYQLGESYFQIGDRVQAAHEFRQVADQYPESPYAPLALLRAGDANLRLWRRPDLDPSPGQAALAIYQELAGRYPGTDAATRAQLHVRRLKEWFAEKAYKNGMFYLRRRAYDSGIIYFKDVIANYSDTKRAPEALLRLVDSYRAIGYDEERRETCAHLRRFYPEAHGVDKSCPAEAAAAPAPSR